jgi:hypothetical protein
MRRTAITVFAALGAACTVGVTSSGSQAVTSGLGLAMTGSVVVRRKWRPTRVGSPVHIHHDQQEHVDLRRRGFCVHRDERLHGFRRLCLSLDQ